MIFVVWWIALFGVWPLAHPEHKMDGPLLSRLDLALHIVALAYLAHRYWWRSS